MRRIDYTGSNMRMLRLVALLLLLGSSVSLADGPPPELRPDHPERYTVVKGDTLWGIAARFLKEPWRWPEIWKKNPGIKNPNLIYPGDVLVLRVTANGPEVQVERTVEIEERKVVKLAPATYIESFEQAIPTLPPSAILPFLTEPLVVDKRVLESAGYVTEGVDGRILLGKLSQFYARGLENGPTGYYQLFRAGKPFVHPDTNEELGFEALFLGEAKMLNPGDAAKLEVTRSNQEIGPGDRLLPAPAKISVPYYQPRSPTKKVEGRILRALGGVAELGPNSIVVITLGQREGIEEGHVLRIMRHQGERPDPVKGRPYPLPDEDAGLLMVFRPFEKVSYALVMKTNRAVHVLDTVRTP